MLKKPAVLAALGAVGGLAVALGVFVFVLGGGGETAQSAEPTAEPTPVARGGKLGPHITLADRIFNLQSPPTAPVYLKMQAVIEFETTDERWAHVLDGCAAALVPAGLVSAIPSGATPRTAPAEGEEGGSACAAEERALLAEFEAAIGSGRALIEDAVTTIVTAKTPEDVSTTAGKEQLKAEIKQAVEGLLPDYRVTRVLFLNFITQ